MPRPTRFGSPHAATDACSAVLLLPALRSSSPHSSGTHIYRPGLASPDENKMLRNTFISTFELSHLNSVSPSRIALKSSNHVSGTPSPSTTCGERRGDGC